MKKLYLLGLAAVAVGIGAFAIAKAQAAAKTLTLGDTDVAVVHTTLGFTTILQFDSPPTSVVLGDADAFKAEYVGSGLALKPLIPRAVTNLFVLADNSRFNFRLISGSAAQLDYVLKIKRANASGYPVVAGSSTQEADGSFSKLIRRSLNRKRSCGGLRLSVHSVAWPESQSTYLAEFRVEALPSLKKPGATLNFEPGDFEVIQGGRSVPIENLYLEKLALAPPEYSVRGTLTLRQASFTSSAPLTLRFYPDFYAAKHSDCLRVTLRQAVKSGKERL